MFQVMTGMSKKEWNAQGLTADQRGIPHVTPTLDFSDDTSGEHSEDAAAHKPQKQQDIVQGKYRRSEQERDRHYHGTGAVCVAWRVNAV